MKKTTTASLSVLATLVGAGAAAMLLRRKPNQDDLFLKEAASVGLAETRLGRLALERGTTSEVRELGRRVVEDHAEAKEELSRIAEVKDVGLPRRPERRSRKLLARLARLSGGEFDREYLQATIEEHRRSLARFRERAKNATYPDVRVFAGRTATVLERHLERATKIGEGLADRRGLEGRSEGND
jgi:putative membrane protein